MQTGTVVPVHDKTTNAVNTDNRTLRADGRSLYIIHFDKADAAAALLEQQPYLVKSTELECVFGPGNG